MKIAVIGAGWLGLPLCKHLQQSGCEVVATKRKEEDAQQVTYEGVDCFAWQLGQKLPEPFQDCNAYVINIGAGRRHFNKEEFSANMMQLCQQCLTNDKARLLFISTTSVYGERVREITEQDVVEPISDSAIAHVAIEDMLMSQFHKRSTILRLAGLISEDRHPANHFHAKKDVTAAHKMVNLVHRDDVISAITRVLKKKVWGHVLHLCATEHPTRRDYYCWAAEQLGLIPPEFLDDSEQPATGKRIDATGTLETLELELKYASPFDMIPQED